MDFLVEQGPGSTPTVHLTFTPEESSTTFADGLALADNAGSEAAIWIHGTTDERREVLEARGYVSNRTLLQMRAPLPVASTTLLTRAFTEDDIDEFVAVNNRAFHWHPEQSGLTADAVRRDMAADWFDAEGFLLHHIDGVLAGFCWTKIHRDPEHLGENRNTRNLGENRNTRNLGEIYVIAVDPAFHGQGLGKAMTLAGLTYLADVGLTTAMLYVESDNVAAVATYERIGFTTYRTDTLWHRSPIENPSNP